MITPVIKKSIIANAAYYIDKTMSKFANPDGFIDDYDDDEEDFFWEVFGELMGAVYHKAAELKKEQS